MCQVGEAAQLRRYLPAQLVAVEGQICQVGEAAQLRRYLPAQVVAVEGQICQVGEAAQLRRYLPAQVVVFEFQLCNAPVVVGGDAPPLSRPGERLSASRRCTASSNHPLHCRGQPGLPGPFRRSWRPRATLSQPQVQAQRRQWARPLSLWWKASVRGRPASPWGWTRSGRRLSRRTARQSRRPRAPP